MTTKQLIAANVVVFIIIVLLLGYIFHKQDKGHEPLSKRFLHKTTETISYDETVEVYVDLTNDNICYFYYFADQKDAVALACVAKTPTIY